MTLKIGDRVIPSERIIGTHIYGVMINKGEARTVTHSDTSLGQIVKVSGLDQWWYEFCWIPCKSARFSLDEIE